MQKFLTVIVVLCLSSLVMAKTIDVSKQKSTDQVLITSISPSVGSTVYDLKSSVSLTLSQTINRKSVYKNSISLEFLGCDEETNNKRDEVLQQTCEKRFEHHSKLKKSCQECYDKSHKMRKHFVCKSHNIQGTTTLENTQTVLFTPSETLEYGYYEVRVNGLRTDNRETIHPLMYRFKLEKNSVETITINPTNIELKEGTTTPLIITATYKDGSMKNIDSNISWSIADESIVSVDTSNTLHVSKEGETLIQANYEDVSSDMILVTVYKEINGYRLPPEPDPTINNSTLLGIDVNNNGVRDDVERYVIQRYAQDPEFPKTKTALAMQYAWASQKILENPTIESKKYSDDAIDCEFYWMKKKTNDMTSLEGIRYHVKNGVFNDTKIKDKIFNTRERIEQKFSYNAALSGNIFSGREQSLENCTINIDELGE